MNKYPKQTIKNINYTFSKLEDISNNNNNRIFGSKLSEISAMNLIPIVDIYELAQDYFNIDLSAQIKRIKEFYK